MTCKDCIHSEVCDIYYPDTPNPEQNAERCSCFKDKSKFIEMPKNSDNPIDTSILLFDDWNDVTGCFSKNTSYYFEIQGVIEDVAKFSFGSGILYAEAKLKERENNA